MTYNYYKKRGASRFRRGYFEDIGCVPRSCQASLKGRITIIAEYDDLALAA